MAGEEAEEEVEAKEQEMEARQWKTTHHQHHLPEAEDAAEDVDVAYHQ